LGRGRESPGTGLIGTGVNHISVCGFVLSPCQGVEPPVPSSLALAAPGSGARGPKLQGAPGVGSAQELERHEPLKCIVAGVGAQGQVRSNVRPSLVPPIPFGHPSPA
jgi:hypothetical protein